MARRRGRSRGLAAGLVLLGLATACGATGSAPGSPPTAPGTPSASVTGTAPVGLDVHGAPHAVPPPPDAGLADADWPATAAWIARAVDRGRPVVVNFFASWCRPCRREAPLLEQARTASPGVSFLGVAYRDRRADARRFLRETGLGLPTLLDFDGSVGDEMGVRGMPNTFFFDASGRLVAVELGELTEESLARRLREIRTPATPRRSGRTDGPGAEGVR